MLDQIAALARVVRYGHDIGLAEAEAADVLLELDELLQHHAVRSGAVVGREQLFLVVDLIDVLPATPEERLQDGGTPDIVQQRVPVNRVFQIAQGLGSDVHVLRVGLLWQQHRLRDGHAELLRQRSVEEFIVGRPPKRIVDDVGALQHGVLQIAAIVGHLMRDAVDNDAVARWFADGRPAETHEFSGDAFRSAEIVDPADERRRKTVLPSAYSSFWVVRRVSNNARKLAMCSIARKKPASRFSLLGSAASVSSPVRARSNRSVERSSFIHSSRPINFSHDGSEMKVMAIVKLWVTGLRA